MKKNSEEKRAIWLKENLHKIICLGVYLILFTPLIINQEFFFPFVGPKSLYFMGLVEIIFFAWIFLIIFSPKHRPSFNPILGSLVLFLIISIVSSVLGVDPFYSFWSKFERMTGILMMLHLLAFFLVVSSIFNELEWRRIFAISLFVGAIISFIALTSDNPSMRGGATIGNDSFLGTYLLFNLFLALYLILKDEFRIYSLICFLVMFLSLFLSGARAAKLSFLGGIILFFFLWLACHKNKKLRLVGISLLIFSLIGGIYFALSVPQSESFVRKKIVERVVGETFGGRFVVWQEAWENFLEKPLLGWGLENFEFAFSKNYNSCFGTPRCGSDVWYDRAHNIIFDTLLNSGIMGMFSYVIIFISTFYVIWRNYLKKGCDFWLAGAFSALLISYSIQNLTVFDMVSSYMIFFLVLGFIAKKKEALENEVRPINIFFGILILIIFLISFINFVFLPFQTDRHTISALRAEPFSEERLSFYQKAISSSPVGRYQIRDFFAETTLSASRENVPEEKVKRELDFLIRELEKNTEENPLSLRSYLKLGHLYNSYSRIDSSKIKEAERVFKEAIELSPANQKSYWGLAQVRLYQGKPQEALSLAEKATELEPHLKQSHMILVEVAKIIGNLQLAEQKIQEAIEINPAWEEDLKKI